MGAAGEGHERSLSPVLSESYFSGRDRRWRLLPSLIAPLLQLLDGARCPAAPAILPDDLHLARKSTVPPELCTALPTLYAALAAVPPAAAGGGQGEALRCCERYDYESMLEREQIGEGMFYIHPLQPISKPLRCSGRSSDLTLRLHPQMTAGALAAWLVLERGENVPVRRSAFFLMGRNGPMHPGMRLGSLLVPEDKLMWVCLSLTVRPGESAGGEGFDPQEQLSCALCQSPEHMQAARDLEAGPRERFLAEMEAAAAVMRAAAAANA